MRKLTTLIAALSLFGTSMLGSSTALAVDASFDVFFEVDFDPDTGGPSISAQGTQTTTQPTRTTTIDIEIVALSLVSSPGPGGSTQHEATLSYNIGSSGQDGVRGKKDKPNTAYAELDIVCHDDDPVRAASCDIVKARSSDKHKHRGRVTVLKQSTEGRKLRAG